MVVQTREDKNLVIPKALGNFVTEGSGGGGVSPEEAREIAEEVVTDALVDYVDETQLSDTLADYATTAETANNSEDIAELSGATMAIEQSIDGFATTADTKAIQDSLENYATTADTKAIQDSLGDFATTADTKAIQDSLADYATTADTAAIQQSLGDYATTADTKAIQDSLADYSTTADTKAIQDSLANYSTTADTKAVQDSLANYATTADTKAIQDGLDIYATTATTDGLSTDITALSGATSALTASVSALSGAVKEDVVLDIQEIEDMTYTDRKVLWDEVYAKTVAGQRVYVKGIVGNNLTTVAYLPLEKYVPETNPSTHTGGFLNFSTKDYDENKYLYYSFSSNGNISGTVNGGGRFQIGTIYSLPTASSSTLGGIKVGSGLSIDNSSKLSVKAGEGLGFSGDSLTIKTGEGLVYDENGNLTVAGGDGTMLSPADFSEGDPDGDNGAVVTRGYDGQYQVYVLNDEVPEDPNDGQRKVVLYDDDALSEGVEIGVGGDFGRWQTAEVIYDSLYIRFMMIADIEEGSLTNQRFKFYLDGYDPEENNLVVKDYDDNELSWEYLTEIEANQGNEKSGIYLRDGLKEGYVPMDSRIFYDLDAMLADGSVEYFLADIYGGRLDWDRVYLYYTTETLEGQKERRLYKIRNVQNEVWISSNESSRAYDSIVVDSWYINPDGGMNQLSKTVVQNQSIPTVPSPSFVRFGNDEKGYLTFDADNGYFLYDNGTIATGVTSAYSQDLVDYLFTDTLRSGGLIFGYLLPINQNNFYVIKNGETKLYCHPALSFRDLASSVTIDDTEFSKEVTYKYADWELTMWYAEGNKGANLRIIAL